MQAFENLVGGSWKAEGEWGDGTPFKQHIEFEWGLSQTIIKSKTFGNISTEGNEFGLRNVGIRAWSSEDSVMVFWEFDIFGGITEGTVKAKGKDVYYHYTYDAGQGPMELTDAWIFKDNDTYEFIVGVFREGKWEQQYLSTRMEHSR